MRKSKTARYIAALVVAMLVNVDHVWAAAMEFRGSTSAPFHYIIYQDHGVIDRFAESTVTRNMDVLLDPVGPTSFYASLSYVLDHPITYTWTQTRQIPGTFTSIPITTTVTVDPVTITKTNYGPLQLHLRPGTSGQYVEELNSLAEPFHDLFDPLAVTGNYSITGPTESISGTFSQEFVPNAVSGQNFDVLNFPTSVRVQHLNNATYFNAPYLVLFDGTVDGVPWDIQINHFIFDDGSAWETLIAVPEPSTFVLAAMGALLLVVRRHRSIVPVAPLSDSARRLLLPPRRALRAPLTPRRHPVSRPAAITLADG